MSTESRFLVCAAFKYAAECFHSGQWSKGYAKLCQLDRIGYREGLGNCWKQKESPERNEAALLLWKRRKEIRLTW
jgi:hypothetical protein